MRQSRCTRSRAVGRALENTCKRSAVSGESRSAPDKVAVLGAGSWGTALALHLARLGRSTVLWGRDRAQLEAIQAAGRNPRYLQEHAFPESLTAEPDLIAAVRGATVIVCAVPSHGLRETLRAARDAVAGDTRILLACKGVEMETLETMHQVTTEELPQLGADRVAALGGPSFAAEVAAGLPTTVVVASTGPETRLALQDMLSGGGIRAYVSDDVVGVELGGALKNIIALAAGMCDGAGLGQNARAGLITRGLAEVTRLAVTLGADPGTLAGLAGVGDLVLTCTGGLSRNRRVGLALGEGKSLEEALREVGMVAEGVKTTRSTHALALREGVEMPIVATMHAILYEGLTVQEAVEQLMGRRLRAEKDE